MYLKRFSIDMQTYGGSSGNDEDARIEGEGIACRGGVDGGSQGVRSWGDSGIHAADAKKDHDVDHDRLERFAIHYNIY